MNRFWRATASVLAIMLTATPALGWEPTKPVEIVVAAGAGGASDQMARMMQAAIQKNNLMKQPMVVSLKGGASGAEALMYMKSSDGDPHKFLIAYSLIYFCNVLDWPLNIGNRPPHGPPANIPITFELTVLIGCLTCVLAMLGMNGLPQPYHPLFNVERFACASKDRLFLCIEARDPRFDLEATKRFLAGQHARDVWEVPR